jgi:hypothetical protein
MEVLGFMVLVVLALAVKLAFKEQEVKLADILVADYPQFSLVSEVMMHQQTLVVAVAGLRHLPNEEVMVVLES